MQQAIVSPLKRIRLHEEIRELDTKNTVASVGKSGVGEKSNQQTKKVRTKTNYTPKANDKEQENNAIFFETWPSSVYKKNELKYRRAVHCMS